MHMQVQKDFFMLFSFYCLPQYCQLVPVNASPLSPYVMELFAL